MANNPMRRAPVFPRQQPIEDYAWVRLNAIQASSTPIGDAATVGQYVGRIVVSNAGTGCTLTLSEGTGGSAQTILAFPLAVGSFALGIRASGGLYYTLTGSGSPDVLVTYLDMPG